MEKRKMLGAVCFQERRGEELLSLEVGEKMENEREMKGLGFKKVSGQWA